MSRTTGYYLPPTAAPKLEALVDHIEANRGDLIDLTELDRSSAKLDIRNVMATLPEGITEEDFIGMLKLAMFTEAGTDSYAAVFEEGAIAHNAPWLTRFNQNVWVPDEHTHYAPYKYMLQSLGYSEEELEQGMSEVKERHYEHCCGKTPVELSTYGVIQEYLTDNWHGILSKLMKDGAPYASHCANLVKRRETLHTLWYRDMTAVMVEENPELLSLVADTMVGFQMPGTKLVPQFGPRALDWMTRVNVDFDQIARDLVRNFTDAAGSIKRTGQLLIHMAVRRGYPIGPFPPRLVRGAMDRLGGPGYGLIGEAILDKVGLPLPRQSEGKLDSGMRFYSGAYERIRARMRKFIGERIDLRTITGETTAA